MIEGFLESNGVSAPERTQTPGSQFAELVLKTANTVAAGSKEFVGTCSIPEILDAMALPERQYRVAVGKALSLGGWTLTQPRKDGRQVRRYVHPDIFSGKINEYIK